MLLSLFIFDWNKPLIIHMDASLYGAGAVLMQETEDESKQIGLHPVAFASWLFDSTQRRYSATDRELLTLILLTRKFKPYFFVRQVTAYTDHQPMPGYLKRDPHGRLARWFSKLNQFSIDIKYLPGDKNVAGDCLSRVGRIS